VSSLLRQCKTKRRKDKKDLRVGPVGLTNKVRLLKPRKREKEKHKDWLVLELLQQILKAPLKRQRSKEEKPLSIHLMTISSKLLKLVKNSKKEDHPTRKRLKDLTRKNSTNRITLRIKVTNSTGTSSVRREDKEDKRPSNE
jgi:hypothetical protein